MGRQYSPQTVLRKTPNALLKPFFEKHRCAVNADWDNLTESDIEPLLEALSRLKPNKRDEVEAALRDVFDLACEEGTKALIESGNLKGIALTSDLAEVDGPYHKSMWVCLDKPPVFKTAVQLFQTDHLSRGTWRKRKDLPKVKPAVDHEARQRLKGDLSDFYSRTQGRGQRCTVEHLLRHGTDHYFFAYPDDYVDTVVCHDNDGRLSPRPERRAFEIVFIYNASDGTLNLHARGDKKLKASLQDIFGKAILGQDLGPENPTKRTYNLDHLKKRSCKLVTDPEDPVEARIVAMRMTTAGRIERRVTLEADKDKGREDIYDMIEQWINQANVPLDSLLVSQVRFQFTFKAVTGRAGKSLTFTVTWPDSSDLKSKRVEHRLIGEKYLKRWGIDGG